MIVALSKGIIINESNPGLRKSLQTTTHLATEKGIIDVPVSLQIGKATMK